MSCRLIFVKLSDADGTSPTDVYDMTDNNGNYVFAEKSYAELVNGITVSISTSAYEFYLSNITQTATYSLCNPAPIGPVPQFSPDADTILLVRFDGLNNSTQFSDASFNNFGVTANSSGTARVVSNPKMVGNGSLYIDSTNYDTQGKDNVGNRNLLFVGTSSQFRLGTSSFTIEWWMYPQSRFGGVGGPVFANHQNGTNWSAFAGSNNVGFGNLINGNWTINVSTPVDNNLVGTWSHVAIVRNYTTGVRSDWNIFINGATQALTLNVGTWGGAFTAQPIQTFIGSALRNFSLDYVGYIDELRLSSTARYIGNFNPFNPS